MKLFALPLILLFSFSVFSAPAKLATCQACHGEKGLSTNEVFPNIKGQKKEYLVKQLKDFKSGARKDVMMYDISRRLTDKDMESLSQYFSQFNP